SPPGSPPEQVPLPPEVEAANREALRKLPLPDPSNPPYFLKDCTQDPDNPNSWQCGVTEPAEPHMDLSEKSVRDFIASRHPEVSQRDDQDVPISLDKLPRPVLLEAKKAVWPDGVWEVDGIDMEDLKEIQDRHTDEIVRIPGFHAMG